jgi:hypothetical protein
VARIHVDREERPLFGFLAKGGHFQAAVLARQIRAEAPDRPNDTFSTAGFGANVSGQMFTKWRRARQLHLCGEWRNRNRPLHHRPREPRGPGRGVRPGDGVARAPDGFRLLPGVPALVERRPALDLDVRIRGTSTSRPPTPSTRPTGGRRTSPGRPYFASTSFWSISRGRGRTRTERAASPTSFKSGVRFDSD